MAAVLGLLVMPIAAGLGAGGGRSSPSGPDVTADGFFEDFNYSTPEEMALAGWNLSGLPVLVGGSTVMLDDDGTDASQLVWNGALDFEDYAIEVRERWIGRSGGTIRMASVNGAGGAAWGMVADGQAGNFAFDDNGTLFHYGSYHPQLDAWHVLRMVKSGNSFSFYLDDVLIFKHLSAGAHMGITEIWIRGGALSGNEMDWLRMTRIAPRPRVESVGISVGKAIYAPGETVNIGLKANAMHLDAYSPDWNRTIPGDSYESAKTATDGEFLYVIGTGNTTGSNSSAMLMKYDGDGNELWNRSWGGAQQDIPLDVMVNDGVVYVVGNMGDGIYPDPMFLLAYNASGAELWNRTWGGAAMDWAQGMVAVNGTLYITGWTTSFGAGGVDAFVVGFNMSSRTFGQNWTWGDWGDDFGYGITCMNGSLYVCVYSSNSAGNAGIVKFDMDGNEIWNETWGLGGAASSIATDGSSVFVAGSMRDGGSHAAFLRAYSGGRQLLMEKRFGEQAYDDIFWGIRVQNGVAYCIGSTQSYSGDHSWNACLVGYDTGFGNETMNISFGGPDEDRGSGIAVDSDWSIYCSGGSFDNSSGRWEMFLAKYSDMPKMAGMPIRFDVLDPAGLPYHYLEDSTGSGGEGADSFMLPEDVPEGIYNCTVTVNDSGVLRQANASFEVRWPWSGVLELASSLEARSYLPGETVRVSSYAGYEYPPALGKRPAPGMELRGDLLDTNMTAVTGSAGRTNDTGWAGFVFDIPANASEGIHTVEVRGFEGLNRTVRFNVILPEKQVPTKRGGPAEIPLVPILGTAAIGLVAVALAIGATETGRFGFFVSVAPLYTRIRRDKALSHRVRHLIIGYLADNPGQHYNGLKKALKLSNSVMVYHLSVLEREGFIKSQRDGTLKRFYPISVKTPETRKRTPTEIDSDIVAAIEKRPGMTQKELVKHLVLSNDIVKNHLRNLLRDDQIVARKKGKARVFFLPGKG